MGRSSIIYVIGLSLLVGVVLRNINERGTTSQDSYVTYYGRTMAHTLFSPVLTSVRIVRCSTAATALLSQQALPVDILCAL